MATTKTLTGLNDRYAESTSVAAYPESNWQTNEPFSGAPKGSSTATGTVSSDSVTLTGLADSTRYVLVNSSGTRVYTHFDTFDPTTNGATPAGRATSVDPSVVEIGDIQASARASLEGAINVKDAAYGGGAVGNGTTDDTAAVLAAIAALPSGGGGIYFPPGDYSVSSTLPVNTSGVTLYGAGSRSSKITLAASSSIDTYRAVVRFNTDTSNTPARLTDCALRFLTVNEQGGDQSYTAGGAPGAVVAYGVDGVAVENCRILNGRDKCLELLGCTDQRVRGNSFNTCYWQGAANALEVRGSATVESDDAIISNNHVKHTTTVTITGSTASANTATFTTSAAHKFTAGQPIKVTGVDVAAYNGYWTVATAPTTTTFTVSLGSTPAAGTGGTITVIADRNIYVGSLNAYRLICSGNNSQGAIVGIAAEVATPGAFDLVMDTNVVSDFRDIGLGVNNSSNTGLLGHRGLISNNIVRGTDSTTTFGTTSVGSVTGITLNGEVLRASGNIVTNVRQGILAALDADVEETDLAINNNTIVLASDANGDGIKVSKSVNSGTLFAKRVKITGNQIDGLVGTTSRHGIHLVSRIKDFEISGNTVRGMGRHGVYLETANSAGPSVGRILGNDLIDNSTSSSGTYHGIQIDGSSDDVTLGPRNKAYDTRTPKLQGYGLRIESGATNIRSTYDDYTGNLTGEVSDGTTAKISVQDYRDPLGYGIPFTVWPNAITTTAAWSAAGRVVYARCLGGGSISKIAVYTGTVDSATPGTTDQIAVAVYSPSGTGRSAVPGTRKAVSSSTTAVASTENQVSLGATIRVNEGDFLALGVASTTTTVQQQNGTTATSAINPGFLAAEVPSPVVVPPSTYAGSSGAAIKVPVLIGIP